LISNSDRFYLPSNLSDLILMPKRTYQPKKRKRATTHGFLVRSATPAGKKVILRRRRKGRAALTVSG
jgi:large subunit ribosomal protein L34